MTYGHIACPGCGYARNDDGWPTYHCPACGAFNEPLYRAEHADPARAQTMTRAEIVAEFAAVGQPDPFGGAPEPEEDREPVDPDAIKAAHRQQQRRQRAA